VSNSNDIFGKGFAIYSLSVCFIYLYRIPAVTEFVESSSIWIMVPVVVFFGIPAVLGYFLGAISTGLGVLIFFSEYAKEELDYGIPWLGQVVTLVAGAVFIGMLVATHNALGF
jgi:hypothetical protein